MGYVDLEENDLLEIPKVTSVTSSAKTIITNDEDIAKTITYDKIKFNSLPDIKLTISVVGATSISISDGDITYTKTGSRVTFNVVYDEYTISATDGTHTVTDTIDISENRDYFVELNFVYVYGIQRDQTSSSPEWTRTDDSIGKTATASIGNVTIGSSDFDNCYPWSEMTRVTFGTGDVMVYIPEFYYMRTVENNIETIKISNKPVEGFEKHPGSDKYVSAYFGVGSENKSVSGQQNSRSFSLNSMRTTAAAKGSGWQITDIAVWSALQMLILVEFADNDVQTVIGKGDSNQAQNNSTRFNYWSTGACDNMTYQTGVAANGYTVVYRGIEGLWGLAWIGLDGIIINGGNSIYVTTDSTKFGSSNMSDYTLLSYTTPIQTAWNPLFIKENGYDSTMPWVMIPTTTSNGSSTTYFCDGTYTESGTTVPLVGGGSDDTNYHNGIFCIANVPATKDVRHHGLRYVYNPSLDPNNTAGVPIRNINSDINVGGVVQSTVVRNIGV